MNNKTPPVNNTSSGAPSVARALWQRTCVLFTIFSLSLMLLSAILWQSVTEVYVSVIQFLLLLPFALLVALAGMARRSALPTGAKVALHPILSLGGFYLCVYLPYQLEKSPSGAQVLMILLLVALVYGIAMGIVALCTAGKRQKAIDETPYVSQFNNPRK